MTLLIRGAKGLAVAVATGTAAVTSPPDHSIITAVITATGGILAIIFGQVIAEAYRRRRNVDHHAELADEQAQLVTFLLAEIATKDAEIDRLKRHRRA